jgi:hypothetical protein
MSAPVLPVVIRDASIFVFDGLSYYFSQEGSAVSTSRGTEQTTDDFFGRLGETSHGTPMGEVSLTPTGMIRNLAKLYPYGPKTIDGVTVGAAWYAGQSILTGSGYHHTKSGKKSLYTKCGLAKSPTLNLNPRKQLFGPMTFRYINSIAVQPTTASALKTISDTAFNDASFDEEVIVKDIYTATLGARLAPFDAMGARDGFEIEPIYELEEVPDVNVGVADIRMHSVAWRCRFAPNNLTEAQLDELCSWQGASAVIAGMDVSILDEDLIIDSDAFTVTLHKVGVVKGDNGFGAKRDRNGNVEFVNRMTFTNGIPNPLITMTINL